MKISHLVPAYSQRIHIKDRKWQNRSCGIVSLAMVLNSLGGNTTLGKLLNIGQNLKFTYKDKSYSAYSKKGGWNHWGLVRLAEKQGFEGVVYDWNVDNDVCKKISKAEAFKKTIQHLRRFPLLASVHNSFDKARGGHLIVLIGADGDKLLFNDPDAKTTGEVKKEVAVNKFLNGWKKRIIILKA